MLRVFLFFAVIFFSTRSFAQAFDKTAFLNQFSNAGFKEKVALAAGLGSGDLESVYHEIKDTLLVLKKRVYNKTTSNEAKFLFDLIDAKREINERQFHKAIFVLENSLRFHTNSIQDSLKVFCLLEPAYMKLRNYNKAFEIEELMERNMSRFPESFRSTFTPQKGRIYFHLGLYNESIASLRKEFNSKTPAQQRDTSVLGNYLNDMGVHFNRANNLDSAVFYFNKAKILVDAKKRTDENKVYFEFFSSLIGGNIASVLAKQKRYEEAIAPLKKDIYYSLRTNNFLSAANSYNLLAECYLETKRYDLARRNIDSCKPLLLKFEELNPTLNNLLAEAKYYKSIGNLTKASEFYDNYIRFKDSITRVDNENKLIDQQVTFDLYRKESLLIEKEKIIQKNKLYAAQAKSERAYLILGIIILLFVVMILVIGIKMTRRRQTDLSIKNKHIVQQKTIIENALKEKEFLIKEIHHRVKNNLQIVSSMLNLQADRISNEAAKDVLMEGRQRINSMALIHQLLYNQRSMSFISIDFYLKTLVEQIEKTFNDQNGRIKVNTNCEAIKLDLDTAIPLGLIVNELITNSFKHAFKNANGGRIDLSLHKTENTAILTVKDNGTGFDYTLTGKQGLGMELVNILTDQINGTITFSNKVGTEVQIVFPAQNKVSSAA